MYYMIVISALVKGREPVYEDEFYMELKVMTGVLIAKETVLSIAKLLISGAEGE